MSHDLTFIAIEGGVVTKPKIRHNSGGTAIVKFGVVCQPKWLKGGVKVKDSKYFTVTAMGKTGETVFPLLKVGVPIRVEGEYNDGIYRDAITDEPKIGRVVYASRIKLLVFWKYRSREERKDAEKEQINNISFPNLEDLPF